MLAQNSTKPVSPAIILTLVQQQPAPVKLYVRCDACNDATTATRERLQTCGWFIGRGEAFCPRCNTPE